MTSQKRVSSSMCVLLALVCSARLDAQNAPALVTPAGEPGRGTARQEPLDDALRNLPPYVEPTVPVTETSASRPPERALMPASTLDVYDRADGTSYHRLSQDEITRAGLRLFALGTETANGRQMTKVRLRPRSGADRVGWINQVPTEADVARAAAIPAIPPGVVGGVVGALPAVPPPPAASPGAPVRLGGNIRPPAKTKHVNPDYPLAAQQAGDQGVVIIEATIGTNGSVRDAKVLRSIPRLDRAALEAVRQWEFQPTLLDGVPVAVIMTVTVLFTFTR